jgi:hypothetical protein
MSGGKLVIQGQETSAAAVTAQTEKVTDISESLTQSLSAVKVSDSKPRGRRAKPKQ